MTRDVGLPCIVLGHHTTLHVQGLALLSAVQVLQPKLRHSVVELYLTVWRLDAPPLGQLGGSLLVPWLCKTRMQAANCIAGCQTLLPGDATVAHRSDLSPSTCQATIDFSAQVHTPLWSNQILSRLGRFRPPYSYSVCVNSKQSVTLALGYSTRSCRCCWWYRPSHGTRDPAACFISRTLPNPMRRMGEYIRGCKLCVVLLQCWRR